MKKNLAIILVCLPSILFAQDISLYVGTYTDSTSNGIYHYNFNSKTGEISNQQLAAKTKNPSFLTFSSNKKYLFSVNEVDNYDNTNNGFVSSFLVKKNGTLQLLNEINSNGAHPCHISLNKEGTKAAISNYSGGTISIHEIGKTGINQANQIINHNVSVKKSHAHSSHFFNNELFVADLGLDYLAHYKNNGHKYLLNTNYSMTNKAGPRHFEITENGNFIYVINELNSTITVLKKKNEAFNKVQNISTLDTKFKGENFCADIHLSKDENYLYGSNRGENTIVVFKINKSNGLLKKIQTISTYGNWPRNFTLSPTGNFLLVANQKSRNISVYSLNQDNGKLTFFHSKNTPTPVCLLF